MTDIAVTEDEIHFAPFLKVWVKDTLQSLLDQEDIDGDTQITVNDQGPKVQYGYLTAVKC